MPTFPGRDGQPLFYTEAGSGRPLVWLHGFIGNGRQMLQYGPAAALIDAGYRVILPDLRGHGQSAHPHEPAGYPPDVLADDGLALVDHLGLADYVLGGYSLGGRVVLRMLIRGARPARAVLAGQGLDVLAGGTERTGGYRTWLAGLADGKIARDAWTQDIDPQALIHVLDSMVPTPQAELAEIATPTLVVIGAGDDTHPGAEALAAALPGARFAQVPGDHGSAFQAPELTTAILDFLGSAPRA